MGEKLPPRELELYKRCDEVLHYVWDPIGVAGAPGARDEYESYLPGVFALVKEGAAQSVIATWLNEIEAGMGLEADPERAAGVADLLLDWRKHLWTSTS